MIWVWSNWENKAFSSQSEKVQRDFLLIRRNVNINCRDSHPSFKAYVDGRGSRLTLWFGVYEAVLGCAVVCLWVYSVWSHGTVPLEGCIHFWKWGMKEDICSVDIISFHCRAPSFRACVWCREAHYLHESSRCLAWRGLCVLFISCLESFCFLWKPLGRYCWDRGIVFSVIVKLAPVKWNTASSFIASFLKMNL